MVDQEAPALIRLLDTVDDVLHQKARLGIMTTLVARGHASFGELKSALGLTDGNLSTHLTLMERKGYLTIKKSFRGKRPHTEVRPTEDGRTALESYIALLDRIVSEARQS